MSITVQQRLEAAEDCLASAFRSINLLPHNSDAEKLADAQKHIAAAMRALRAWQSDEA